MISSRLAAKVSTDFESQADEIARRLDALVLPFLEERPQEVERVQAAIVLSARGDRDRFDRLTALAEADWRDVLVGAGLAGEDWEDVLLRFLGPT